MEGSPERLRAPAAGAGGADAEPGATARRWGGPAWIHLAGPSALGIAAGLEAAGAPWPLSVAGGLAASAAVAALGWRRSCVERLTRQKEALHAELERLRPLVEGTDVFAWEFEPDEGRFTYVAPQIVRFGYTLEEWMEPGFLGRITHPDDLDQVVTTCGAATARGEDHEMSYRFVTPEGESVWIRDLVRVVRRPGRGPLLRGVFVDVHEQKLAELELARLSEQARIETEHLQLALTGGNIGMWDWNPASGRLQVSDTWVEISGLERQDLRGTTEDWSMAVHEDDLAAALDSLERHFSGESPIYEATFRKVRKDGGVVWMVSRGKVVAWDDQWNPVRMVGVEIDRTDEVERGLENERLRKEAEQSNRTKSEFLANMSHEIRTPLTAILGYAELFRSGVESIDDAESVRQMLETIQQAGDHLLAIINDILDLSKIEAERLQIETHEVDLASEVLGVLDMVLPRAQGKGVELEAVVESPIPSRVRIDAMRMRQILVNLLGNAVKFTAQGSVVLRVAASEAGGLVFEVQDTGPGMDQDRAAALFQPFSQGDGSVTRNYGGTGLGLTISRRLARLMGGDVWLDWSEPGVGSRFVAHVPAPPVEGAASITRFERQGEQEAERHDHEAPSLNGAHVLLVEDGRVNQRLISAMLRRGGAQVTVADDGVSALEVLREGEARFDLILTDMQMPQMDGYSLTRRLRSRGWDRPIIALTAHAMAEDRARCLEAGCDDFASKPVDRVALLRTCAEWVARAGRHRAA